MRAMDALPGESSATIMPTRSVPQLCIDGVTYMLSASRSRQYWLGEWSDDANARYGVVAAPCRSAEEAIELAREAARAAHCPGRE